MSYGIEIYNQDSKKIIDQDTLILTTEQFTSLPATSYANDEWVVTGVGSTALWKILLSNEYYIQIPVGGIIVVAYRLIYVNNSLRMQIRKNWSGNFIIYRILAANQQSVSGYPSHGIQINDSSGNRLLRLDQQSALIRDHQNITARGTYSATGSRANIFGGGLISITEAYLTENCITYYRDSSTTYKIGQGNWGTLGSGDYQTNISYTGSFSGSVRPQKLITF